MSAGIALFLRDPVPDDRLLPALAAAFGAGLDGLRIVDYAEGFATGVGIDAVPDWPTAAAWRLAGLLGTEVLLEDGSEWLLFAPGCAAAREVNVVELRDGLAIAPDLRLVPGLAYRP